jgi:hypothetical protein
MSVDTSHTEYLEIFGFEDKNKTFGTLEITVITHAGGEIQNTWIWRGGPAGFDSGDFEWKTKLLVLNSTVSNPKCFAWAVTNWSWRFDNRPIPRVPPWFSDKDTIHVVNEEKPPYQEFVAKPRK